ncbi:MAG TPA: hypothetical protein VMW27_20765, partial [Thermoanaerobaculia bacterium]|nr:hypothetical protein [Thermoanaerobaculia bacterium]
MDELLAWLVQSYRSQYLAAPDVPSAGILPDWADGAGFADFPIDYEPRCIAVSPDGPRVAVGTKAGSVFLARWDDEKHAWVSTRDLGRGHWQDDREGEPALQAIRAIAMPDLETLVAGWGPGNFRIVKLEGRRGSPEVVNVAPMGVARGGEPRWMLRFSRMLSLQPPGRKLVEGPLVLGLSIGSQVHLLSLQGDRYEVCSEASGNLGLGWKQDWGRIIDGVWALGHLWLLSSSLQIHCYTPGQDGPKHVDSFSIEYRKRGGALRGLSGCDYGLSVLASGYVTFLRFSLDPAGGAPRLESQGVHWVRMPDATDCSVCL